MGGGQRRLADKSEEILWIEMSMRILENDALGRYIHDRKNLKKIMKVLGKAYRDLQLIKIRSLKGCPPGWSHIGCACVPNIGSPDKPYEPS